jgi:hypothetical protein
MIHFFLYKIKSNSALSRLVTGCKIYIEKEKIYKKRKRKKEKKR